MSSDDRWSAKLLACLDAGTVMELTQDEYFEMLQQPCHYCGQKYDEDQMVVDRLNSNCIYYRHGNVKPACWDCNTLKCCHLPSVFIGLMQLPNLDAIPSSMRIRLTCEPKMLAAKGPLIASGFPPIPRNRTGVCCLCHFPNESLVFDSEMCWDCYERRYFDPEGRAIYDGRRFPYRVYSFDPPPPPQREITIDLPPSTRTQTVTHSIPGVFSYVLNMCQQPN